jgi:hypothetical protein
LAAYPHPEHGYRACLGLLRLQQQYGAERLEAACSRALALGSARYRTVADILKRGQERLALPGTACATTPAHANLRGAKYYQ